MVGDDRRDDDDPRSTAELLLDVHESSPEMARLMAQSAPRLHRMLLLVQAQRRLRQGLLLTLPGALLLALTSAPWLRTAGVLLVVFGVTLLGWAFSRWLAARRPPPR